MVLLDAIETPAQARVYATEQASPLYVALRRRMPRLRGSEFAAVASVVTRAAFEDGGKRALRHTQRQTRFTA